MDTGAQSAPDDTIRIMVQIRIDQEAYRLGLTASETAVLNLVCDGMSDREICAALGENAKGLKNRCGSIYRAFGVNSRAALLAKIMGRR